MPSMEEIENNYNMSQIEANYNQGVPDDQSVPESQFHTATPDELPKEQPGFLKSVEMITSGAAQGSLEFTARLLNQFNRVGKESTKGTPLEKLNNNEDSVVTNAYKYWEDKNNSDASKYNGAGVLQGMGSVPAELLTTAPTAKAFGAVAKAADWVGKKAPTGLQTLGKYGTAGAGGALGIAGLEGIRFDPENPEQAFSAEQAQEALTNPVSYMLPMAAQKLSGYVGSAQTLAGAKETLPRVMALQTEPASATRTAKMMAFGMIPSITGFGKLNRQLGEMGETVGTFVTKMANGIKSPRYDDVQMLAGKHIGAAGKRLEIGEDLIWDQPFKTSLIKEQNGLKQQAEEAISLIEGSGISGASLTQKSIQNILKKPTLTVEEAKKLHSQVATARVNALDSDLKGAGNDLASELKLIQENIMTNIQTSIGPEGMKAFSAAQKYSADKFKLYEKVPKLKQAITDEVMAMNLADSLVSKSHTFDKQALLGELSSEGKNIAGAAFVAKALKAADEGGKFNITTFVKNTGKYSQGQDLMKPDAYNSIKGLNEYLLAAQEYKGVGWWRQAAALTGAGVGGLVGGPVGAGVAIASYAAANFASNHSPLKTLLNGLVKVAAKTPRVAGKPPIEPSSIYKHIINAIDKHLTRAGYSLTPDGMLRHKNEVDIGDEEDTNQ